MATPTIISDRRAVNALVFIDGNAVIHEGVELHQQMGHHHHFRVKLDYDAIPNSFLRNPKEQIALIGKTLSINLQQGDDSALGYEFRGIITNTENQARENEHGYLLLEGKSPSVLLERGKRFDLFSNKTLATVFQDVIDGVNTKKLTTVCQPAYESKVPFLMQYNESDWEFLQRLSVLSGETLYWTGMDLVFGEHREFPTEKVLYGKELSALKFGTRLLSNNFTSFQYLMGRDEALSQTPKTIETSNSDVDAVLRRSEEILGTERPVRTPIALETEELGSLTEQAQQRKVRTAAETVYVSGISKTAHPRIGRLLNIRVPDEKDSSKSNNIGDFRITKVVHRIDQWKHYECEFEGIPSRLKFRPVPEGIQMPVAGSMLAKVTRNDDPYGFGRILVEFMTINDSRCETWLRVMSPNAGKSDAVGTNRGFVFVPEVGDQVMVGFEQGDPNRPYIMGSMFHGKNSTGGGKNNAVKSIMTRSGIKVVFNDDEQSLHIEDPSGNTWDMDGKGNISVTAPTKMILNSADIEINATKNLMISVGNNLLMSVGNIFNTTTSFLKQTALNYIHLFSATSLFSSKETMQIQSEEITALGSNQLTLHSESSIIANSKGEMDLKSSSKMTLAQDAADVTAVQPEEIALAVVEFRTLPTYDGEFGFDWLRIGDNGEDKYETIIEDAIKTAGSPPVAYGNKTDAFNALKNEYQKIPICKGSPSNITEDEYFVPFLQLYTQNRHNSVTTGEKPPYFADLRVLVTIEQDIEKLEFDYDKTLFTLSTDTLSDTAACVKQQSANVSVKITCHSDTDGFDKDKEIKVWAYPKGSSTKSPAEQIAERKLAGKLIVGKNARKHRKTIKTVLIPVRTNIRGGVENEIDGQFKSIDETYSRRACYQALVYNDIEKFSGILDLSNDPKFKIGADGTYGEYIYQKTSLTDPYTDGRLKPGSYLTVYLADKFRAMSASAPYKKDGVNWKDGYVFAFCFEEDRFDTTASSIIGGQAPVGSPRLIVYLSRDDRAFAHEQLHTLGLEHTHSEETPPVIANNKQKYIYQKRKTNNYISYANNPTYLWQWQWKIINPKLK